MAIKLTPKALKAQELGKTLKLDQKIIDDTKKLLARLKEDGYVWSKDREDWVKTSRQVTILITASEELIEETANGAIVYFTKEFEYANLTLSNDDWKPFPAKEKDGTLIEGVLGVFLAFQNLAE